VWFFTWFFVLFGVPVYSEDPLALFSGSVLSRSYGGNPEYSTQSQQAAPGIGLSASTNSTCPPPYACSANSSVSISGGGNQATLQADYAMSATNGETGAVVQASFDPWIAENSGVYTIVVRESTSGSTTAIGGGTNHNVRALFDLNTPSNPDVSPVSLLWYNPRDQCQSFGKSASLLEVYTGIRTMGICPGGSGQIATIGGVDRRYCQTEGTMGFFGPGATVAGGAAPQEWCMNQSINLVQSETRTITVKPGAAWDKCPAGFKCDCPESCQNLGPADGGINICSGSFHATGKDPITTRGWPLMTNIHVDTHHDERNRSMGNAIFTYDIHVVEEYAHVVTASAITLEPIKRFTVVDGDGARLDFGRINEAPVRGFKVFSDFTKTASGYTLSNAGAPESIDERGNFTYYFNTEGRLQEIVDPQNNRQVLTYDVNTRRLARVDDINSKKYLTFDYEPTGQYITRITENGGPYTVLSYNSNWNLIRWRVYNEDGTVAYTYSIDYLQDNLPSRVTLDEDPAQSIGLTYTYGNDYLGNPTVPLANTTESAPGANDGSRINYLTARDIIGHRSEVTSATGGVTTYDSTLRGQVTKISPAVNSGAATRETTFEYTTKGQQSVVWRGYAREQYAYDADGKVIQYRDDLDTYNYTYTGNNIATVRNRANQLNGTWTYGNTSFPNLPTSFKDSLGRIWTYAYNSYGQLTKVTPPTGSATGATTLAYNNTTTSPYFGWLTSITNGAGQVLRVDAYNKLGEPIKWTRSPSATPLVVEESKDALGRPKVLKNADLSTVTWGYRGGLLSSITDELARVTQVSMCPRCGGIKELTGPLSWNLKWTRDGDFDVTAFRDARGNTTRYEYNSDKELTAVTHADGTGEQYLYERWGRLGTLVNGRGQREVKNYGLFDDEVGSSFPDTGDAPIGRAIVSNGASGTPSRALQSVDVLYQMYTAMTYTATGEVASVEYTPGSLNPFWNKKQRVEYTYYADDLVKTITWKDGGSTGPVVGSWTYTYNGVGAVTKVVNNFGETTVYTYDSHGRVTVQDNQTSRTRVKYTYASKRDWRTRIVEESYTSTGVVTPLYDFQLTYNAVGNVTKITELGGKVRDFGYDALDRLLQESVTGPGAGVKSWGYDLAGNITQKNGVAFGTYDVANKLVSVAGQVSAPVYDGDGNVTSLALSGRPGLSFKWDVRNKLKEIGSTGPARTLQQWYDSETGLLQGKTVVGGESIFYVRDIFGRVLGEYRKSTAGVYGAGKVYTYGADGLVSQRDVAGGASYWYLYGPQEEARALVSVAGAVVSRYEYDPYGVASTKVEGVSNDFEYTGKHGCLTDDLSGLVLCGQRWYSPVLGRWLSRDPIGFAGGVNLYEYVGGSPITAIDPDGNAPKDKHYGINDRDFWDWYHGEKKKGDPDLTKEEAYELYEEWLHEGKPRGKGGKSGRGGRRKGDDRSHSSQCASPRSPRIPTRPCWECLLPLFPLLTPWPDPY